MHKFAKIILSIAATFTMSTTMVKMASASNSAEIIKTASMKNVEYKNKTSKGATYKFNMVSSKKFKFSKKIHSLKSYPHTTWVATKKAYIKNNGTTYLYYYVHNKSKTAYGWVWHGYLSKKSIVPSLSSAEASARAWIAKRESGGSYSARNGVCYGKYQLNLAYLHGNLSAANQEKVAQNYVTSRYGSWVNAKRFWQSHHWY